MWQCLECRPLQCPHWQDCSKCWGRQWWSCHPRFRYCSSNLSQFLFHCPKHSRTTKVKECKPHFPPLKSDCPSKTSLRRSSDGCSLQKAVFDFSHHFPFLFPPPPFSSLKSSFNGLSFSIFLTLILSLFWEEMVGGIERGIKREVQARIKGWRMGGSLIRITCSLMSMLKTIDFYCFCSVIWEMCCCYLKSCFCYF